MRARTKSHIIRCCSAFLAVLFLITDTVRASPAVPVAADDFAQAVNGFRDSSWAGSIIEGLPEDIASIKVLPVNQRQSFKDLQKPFLLHLQDAHSNPQAQRHIAEVLEYLESHFGASRLLIAVEGTRGDLHPEYLNVIPSYPKAGEAVVADLLEKGEFSGAELFAWRHYRKGRMPRIFGVENPEVYKENLESYRSMLYRQSEIQEILEHLQTELLSKGSKILNPALLDFYRERQRRRLGKFEIGRDDTDGNLDAYLRLLAGRVRGVLEIDLESPLEQLRFPNLSRILYIQKIREGLRPEQIKASWEQVVGRLEQKGEIAAARSLETFGVGAGILSGKVSETVSYEFSARRAFEDTAAAMKKAGLNPAEFPDFLAGVRLKVLESEIDAAGLFHEMDGLEKALFDKLSQGDQEKEFIRCLLQFEQFEKLLSLEMTRDEMTSWKESHAVEDLQALLNASSESDRKRLLVFTSEAERFYETARKRDVELFENALDRVREYDGFRTNEVSGSPTAQPVLVLISGGFHSDGIRQQAVQRGLAYAEIAPRIREMDRGERYHRVMSGANADLHTYFGGHESFLTRQEAILLREILEIAVPELQGAGVRGEALVNDIQKNVDRHPVLSKVLETGLSAGGEGPELSISVKPAATPLEASHAAISAALISGPTNFYRRIEPARGDKRASFRWSPSSGRVVQEARRAELRSQVPALDIKKQQLVERIRTPAAAELLKPDLAAAYGSALLGIWQDLNLFTALRMRQGMEHFDLGNVHRFKFQAGDAQVEHVILGTRYPGVYREIFFVNGTGVGYGSFQTGADEVDIVLRLVEPYMDRVRRPGLAREIFTGRLQDIYSFVNRKPLRFVVDPHQIIQHLRAPVFYRSFFFQPRGSEDSPEAVGLAARYFRGERLDDGQLKTLQALSNSKFELNFETPVDPALVTAVSRGELRAGQPEAQTPEAFALKVSRYVANLDAQRRSRDGLNELGFLDEYQREFFLSATEVIGVLARDPEKSWQARRFLESQENRDLAIRTAGWVKARLEGKSWQAEQAALERDLTTAGQESLWAVLASYLDSNLFSPVRSLEKLPLTLHLDAAVLEKHFALEKGYLPKPGAGEPSVTDLWFVYDPSSVLGLVASHREAGMPPHAKGGIRYISPVNPEGDYLNARLYTALFKDATGRNVAQQGVIVDLFDLVRAQETKNMLGTEFHGAKAEYTYLSGSDDLSAFKKFASVFIDAGILEYEVPGPDIGMSGDKVQAGVEEAKRIALRHLDREMVYLGLLASGEIPGEGYLSRLGLSLERLESARRRFHEEFPHIQDPMLVYERALQFIEQASRIRFLNNRIHRLLRMHMIRDYLRGQDLGPLKHQDPLAKSTDELALYFYQTLGALATSSKTLQAHVFQAGYTPAKSSSLEATASKILGAVITGGRTDRGAIDHVTSAITAKGVDNAYRRVKDYLVKTGRLESGVPVRLAFNGAGDVGGSAAMMAARRGDLVVMMQDVNGAVYNKKGFPLAVLQEFNNIPPSGRNVVEFFGKIRGSQPMNREKLFSGDRDLKIDVIVTAATANTINETNVDHLIHAGLKAIVEGGNNTYKNVARKLAESGIITAWGSTANIGGVVASSRENQAKHRFTVDELTRPTLQSLPNGKVVRAALNGHHATVPLIRLSRKTQRPVRGVIELKDGRVIKTAKIFPDLPLNTLVDIVEISSEGSPVWKAYVNNIEVGIVDPKGFVKRLRFEVDGETNYVEIKNGEIVSSNPALPDLRPGPVKVRNPVRDRKYETYRYVGDIIFAYQTVVLALSEPGNPERDAIHVQRAISKAIAEKKAEIFSSEAYRPARERAYLELQASGYLATPEEMLHIVSADLARQELLALTKGEDGHIQAVETVNPFDGRKIRVSRNFEITALTAAPAERSELRTGAIPEIPLRNVMHEMSNLSNGISGSLGIVDPASAKGTEGQILAEAIVKWEDFFKRFLSLRSSEAVSQDALMRMVQEGHGIFSFSEIDAISEALARVPQGNAYSEIFRISSLRLKQYLGVILGLETPSRTSVNLTRLLNEAADSIPELKNQWKPESKSDLVAVTYSLDLFRALKNVLINAAHASDPSVTGRPRQIFVRSRKAPEFTGFPDAVLLEIEDNGTGMTPEIFARVFEPFFTTKGSLGTGLGLPVVKQIVEELLGGKLEVQTEAGKGTTVRIFLPPQSPERSELRAKSTRPFEELESKFEEVKRLLMARYHKGQYGEDAHFETFFESVRWMFPMEHVLAKTVPARRLALEVEKIYKLFREYLKDEAHPVKITDMNPSGASLTEIFVVADNRPGLLADTARIISQRGGDIRQQHFQVIRNPVSGRDVSLAIFEVVDSRKQPFRDTARQELVTAIERALQEKAEAQKNEIVLKGWMKNRDAIVSGEIAVLSGDEGDLQSLAYDIFSDLRGTPAMDDLKVLSARLQEDWRRLQRSIDNVMKEVRAPGFLPETAAVSLTSITLQSMEAYLEHLRDETFQLAHRPLQGRQYRQGAASILLNLVRIHMDQAEHGALIQGLGAEEIRYIAQALVEEFQADFSVVSLGESETIQADKVEAEKTNFMEALDAVMSLQASSGDKDLEERMRGLEFVVKDVIAPKILEKIEGRHVRTEDPESGIPLKAIRAITLTVLPEIERWRREASGSGSQKLLDNAMDLESIFKSVISRIRKQDHAGESLGVVDSRKELTLFARTLDPYRLDSLRQHYEIKAIVTDGAGPMSHWVIAAENWGIPVLILDREQEQDIMDEVWVGRRAIVDGRSKDGAVVVINPSEPTLEAYRPRIEDQRTLDRIAAKHAREDAVTADGHRVEFFANADNAEEVQDAFDRFGAEGVGLVRTEYLFSKKNVALVRYLENPSAENRAALVRFFQDTFAEMALQTERGEITLRMFDMQPDKEDTTFRQLNPGKVYGPEYYVTPLGRELLSIQLEAAIRAQAASERAPIRVLFPMYRSPENLLKLLHDAGKVRQNLKAVTPEEQSLLNDTARHDLAMMFELFDQAQKKVLADSAFIEEVAGWEAKKPERVREKYGEIEISPEGLQGILSRMKRGVMVETLEGLEIMDTILENAHFISVGTNDLTTSLFRELDINRESHPEYYARVELQVLEAIKKRILEKTSEKNAAAANQGLQPVSVTVCGGIACLDTFVVMTLHEPAAHAGLQLSGSSALLPALKEIVRKASRTDAAFVGTALNTEDLNAAAITALQGIRVRQKESPEYLEELDKIRQGIAREAERQDRSEVAEDESPGETIHLGHDDAALKAASAFKQSQKIYLTGPLGMHALPAMPLAKFLRDHGALELTLEREGHEPVNMRNTLDLLGIPEFTEVTIKARGSEEDLAQFETLLAQKILELEFDMVPTFAPEFAHKKFRIAGPLPAEAVDAIGQVLSGRAPYPEFAGYLKTADRRILKLGDAEKIKATTLAAQEVQLIFVGPGAEAVLEAVEKTEVSGARIFEPLAALPAAPAKTTLKKRYLLGAAGMHTLPAASIAKYQREHPGIIISIQREGAAPMDFKNVMGILMGGFADFTEADVTLEGPPALVEELDAIIREKITEEYFDDTPAFNERYSSANLQLAGDITGPQFQALLAPVVAGLQPPAGGAFFKHGSIPGTLKLYQAAGFQGLSFKAGDQITLAFLGAGSGFAMKQALQLKVNEAMLFTEGAIPVTSANERTELRSGEEFLSMPTFDATDLFAGRLRSRLQAGQFVEHTFPAALQSRIRDAAFLLGNLFSLRDIEASLPEKVLFRSHNGVSFTFSGREASLVWVFNELANLVSLLQTSEVTAPELQALVRQVEQISGIQGSLKLPDLGAAVHVQLDEKLQDMKGLIPVLAVVADLGGSLHLNMTRMDEEEAAGYRKTIMDAALAEGVRLKTSQLQVLGTRGKPGFESVPRSRLRPGDRHGVVGEPDSFSHLSRRRGLNLFRMDHEALIRAEIMAATLITVIQAVALKKSLEDYTHILDPRQLEPEAFAAIVGAITTYLQAQTRLESAA